MRGRGANIKIVEKGPYLYRSEWENNPDYASWIQPSTLGNTYFKCKICAKDYIGGTAALKKHMSSKKHQDKITAIVLPWRK